MKQVFLRNVPDGKEFKRSNRHTSVWMKVVRHDGRNVVYTSTNSERSFESPGNTLVFVKA